VIPTLLLASTPLDDFLDDRNPATETGELLQRIGLFGSLFGLTLAAGLIVFLAVVHRGTHREVALLVRLVTIAGAVALIGAAIEIAGAAEIDDLSWSDAFTDASASAPMMRVVAGLSIALGLFEHTVAVVAADVLDVIETDAPPVRWIPASASAFGYVGAMLGLLSFWFDGHTVTQGPRVLHALVDLVHVAAGSVWFGGIVGLTVVAWMRRATGSSIASLVVRFSTVASVALILVALAGSLMALMIIDGFGDLTGTEWGRLLLVKVGAVSVAAAIGGYNHFVIVPALERAGSTTRWAAIAREAVTAEAFVLAFVVALTGLLTVASIN
jgi:copper transport protein